MSRIGTCEPSPTGPRIIVEDDGAGVDVNKLERAARALGITWDGAPLELMFVDGLSTAAHVDVLSGRGVGMSAVRADLREIGYSVESTTHAHGTRFVLAPSDEHAARAPDVAER